MRKAIKSRTNKNVISDITKKIQYSENDFKYL